MEAIEKKRKNKTEKSPRIYKKCEHSKRISRCRLCGGSAFCQHSKSKERCVACGGVSICPHGIRRNVCVPCGGSSICEHGRQKRQCKPCNGSSFCKHGVLKNHCKPCEGSSICEHGRQKHVCKPCGGSSVCEHGNIKCKCKECRGSSVCEHGREKYTCKPCKGFGICEHDKQKSGCKLCGGSALCQTPLCETRASTSRYQGYCLSCFIHVHPDMPNCRNYKTKETETVFRIVSRYPDLSWIINRRVPDGCSRRQPDLQLDMGTHLIFVEIDENRHSSYDCSCEHKRQMEISLDVGHRPIVFIRFNPDAYRALDGSLVNSCWKINGHGISVVSETKVEEWETRLDALFRQVQYWVDNPTDKTVEIVELFY